MAKRPAHWRSCCRGKSGCEGDAAVNPAGIAGARQPAVCGLCAGDTGDRDQARHAGPALTALPDRRRNVPRAVLKARRNTAAVAHAAVPRPGAGKSSMSSMTTNGLPDRSITRNQEIALSLTSSPQTKYGEKTGADPITRPDGIPDFGKMTQPFALKNYDKLTHK